MAVTGKAEREILKKARKVFVDFRSVDNQELIRCYILCSDVFSARDEDISNDNTIRLICARVQKVIDYLPFKESKYIKYKYGFSDGVFYTHEQIANLMQIPVFRIANIKYSALRQFRSKSKSLFVLNVIEQLELEIKTRDERIFALEGKIRELKNSPFEVGINSIDSLKWSVRTYNILKRNGISTIEQLLSLDSERICQWKGAGKVSVGEILDMQKKIIDE